MKKTLLKIFLFGACCLLLAACGKDNYDAPASTLSGKVSYDGNPIGVRGSNNSVRLQLWQDGYALRTPIDVFVTQDGSFTSILFDGTYKLITVPGNGPWIHKSDTLNVQVHGNTQIDFSVEPYFTVSDVQYSLQGDVLTATFQLDQLEEGRVAEDVSLLVNDTHFVDLGHFTGRETLSEVTPGTVSVTLDVADELASSTALFARIAVKASGITEAVYDANIEKIK